MLDCEFDLVVLNMTWAVWLKNLIAQGVMY